MASALERDELLHDVRKNLIALCLQILPANAFESERIAQKIREEVERLKP